MVDFAGWYMPVEYKGLRHEHHVVREKVGLFDVSHMGEIRIKGPQSLATVEWVTSNDVSRLQTGQAQYSLFINEKGGVVDDLIVYCVEPGRDYLLCVNASNTDKDFEWVTKNNRGAEVTNESSKWGQIAVQGPHAMELAARVLGGEVSQIKGFEFKPMRFAGQEVLVARTGYTGEDGVEVFVPAAQTAQMWRELLNKGQDLGVEPIGLGARDTLRTEMKYPLYGHELDDHTNPYAAGLGWVIKPDKKDFIGRSAVVSGKEQGLTHRLVGLMMRERGIARQGYKLFSTDGKEVGFVTSGTPSPTLNDNIAVAYLQRDLAQEGTRVNVDIRGRMVAAEVVATPFVKVKK